MAIVKAKRRWPRDGNVVEAAVREWTEEWLVITDDANDGPLTLIEDAAIPRIGDPYQEANGRIDLGARCVRRVPELLNPNQSPNHWVIRCTYSSAVRRDTIVQQENGAGGSGGGIDGGGGGIDSGGHRASGDASGSDSPQTVDPDPLLRPPTFDWGTTTFREAETEGYEEEQGEA